MGTENGLNLFDREHKTFRSYKNATDENDKAGNKVIRIIREDLQGALWLGTEDRGLLLFDPLTGSFQSFQHQEKDPSSLGSNLVRSIWVDRKGNCWIGSINGGLELYNSGSHSFYRYQNEPGDPFSLSQRTISAIFEDNQGNLWVGTHRAGVNIWMPGNEKFGVIRQGSSPTSLSYNDVKSFCEDSQGKIWVGTDGGGLDLFDREKKSFRHFRYDPFNTKSIGSDAVLDIMEDRQGRLWISTWGGGLNLFDPRTGMFTRLKHDPKDANSISSDYVQKVLEDSKGNLWVATYYGGLNLLDRKTKKFSRLIQGATNQSHISGNNCISLAEDKSGNIWIGTDDGGLNEYDPSTGQFSHYFSNMEKAPDLRVLFVDHKGRIWAGQKGLYLFDATRKTFSLYTDKAGLAEEFIKSITEDEKGDFWIAGSNGLTQFNPETFSFKKYNPGDGLQSLEFEANACLKTKDGEMFFGGVNGFNAFYPSSIRMNPFIPPVFITGIQVLNKKINAGKDLQLSYKQSTLSFNFAALNYTAPENNLYAYKLEGFDQDWNYVNKERKATYTNLFPGEYIFRVKGSNNDQIWNEQGTSIRVVIQPPFWNTWWFKGIAGILLITGILVFYRMRRKIELNKLEENKREEIHQLQLQFFTNISHEFRTPLTLILNPLEKLLKEPPSALFHYYRVMYRNANRLMGLINELMDFRKSEEGVLKLKVMPGNLNLFLSEIAEEFHDLADEKRVTFTVKKSETLHEIWFDRQVLEKIILNLLNNSFKYTANGGSVTVEILTSLQDLRPAFENELYLNNPAYHAKKYIYIRVADNGIGISKESIPHLFERYFRITETHLGSGVGLAFVKSLTFLHKGNIKVYSERHKGTEIIVGLPLGKENFAKEERWIGPKFEGREFLESLPFTRDPGLFSQNAEPEQGPESGSGSGSGSAKGPGLPHILLVEDNDELRDFLKISLGEFYHISEARDGIEGLKKSKEVFPDLIISDVMMPEMNGNLFCRAVKLDEETMHIPFLMLTAKNGEESRLEGAGSGADFYFAKPLSMDLLLLTLRNIFEQKQRTKERYSYDNQVEARERIHSVIDKAFMDQLLEIIESQLINPDLDVDYLCKQIGMSRTKLYQKIKQFTGQSINEFVRGIRLKKAVHIMTHEEVPLAEVIYRIGIQTQSYFTKAFKKEFGKTPSQFLQELDKKGE
ncbi:hybrid sensor histidine kinase/response regulator transcription factor [Flavitalea flava]